MGGRKKLTIEEVASRFKERGLTLLETEYVNNNTPMKCICPEGHIVYPRVNGRGGCEQCGRARTISSHRLTIDYVRKKFEEAGCILLSTEYKNARTPLKYRCNCGTVSTIRYDNFKQGKRCNSCRYKTIAEKQRLDYEHVKQAFTKAGCTLLSTEYVNTHTPLEYICECGNRSTITFSNFHQGARCIPCGIKKRSGEKSPFYKKELTDEHRMVGRNFKELREWRAAVFKRDGYSCVKCHKNGYLNAHHIMSYDTNETFREDMDNGVTLCRECHKDFHRKFGYGNNTIEQFTKWYYEDTQESG